MFLQKDSLPYIPPQYNTSVHILGLLQKKRLVCQSPRSVQAVRWFLPRYCLPKYTDFQSEISSLTRMTTQLDRRSISGALEVFITRYFFLLSRLFGSKYMDYKKRNPIDSQSVQAVRVFPPLYRVSEYRLPGRNRTTDQADQSDFLVSRSKGVEGFVTLYSPQCNICVQTHELQQQQRKSQSGYPAQSVRGFLPRYCLPKYIDFQPEISGLTRLATQVAS